MQHSILVTGASGNLGRKVAYELLKRGATLKVAGRNREKLSSFKEKAPILCGDLEDSAFLQSALEGVSAVFLVMPQLRTLSAADFAAQFARAAEAAGVTHVVNISNCTLKRYGKWTSLLELELALDLAPSLHIKHLRCANFFENLNWGLHTPYDPGIKLPYISSYEIAHVAAAYLENLTFEGKSVEALMGPADYSMQDFADRLGVAYRQQPLTDENSWFFDAFNSGQYELVPRTEANTSRLTEKRFSLEYFLEHHFNREALNAPI
jgi:nucleoside-diphosphate-sugar epimerase